MLKGLKSVDLRIIQMEKNIRYARIGGTPTFLEWDSHFFQWNSYFLPDGSPELLFSKS